MNQLAINFPPDPNDLERFWVRLGAVRPTSPVPAPEPVKIMKAPENSGQQIIWQTEESIALRFSFRVPVYSKSGKLKSWDLQLVSKANLISVEDFADPKAGFHYDANKLAALFQDGARAAIVKRHGLNEEQAKLVEFRGLCVARHLAGTKIEVNDPRWT